MAENEERYKLSPEIPVCMDYANLYTAIAVAVMASTGIVIYYCRAGRELEGRLNSIIKDKNPLISAKYRHTIDQLTIDHHPLTRKEEDKFEDISYARFILNNYMPEKLSEVVTKLSHSLSYSLVTAIMLIGFGYSPTFNLDPATVLMLQILFGASAIYFLARYMTDGIFKIDAFRKFDTKINELDRCQTFEELYASL